MTKQSAATPGRAIGYVRVSSDKQAAAGVSLEAQSARIQAMATLQDAELLEIIVDAGESAKTLHRPGMVRLLAMVDAKHVQAVIVAKLDRLTRSVRIWPTYWSNSSAAASPSSQSANRWTQARRPVASSSM
jgi:site-specific DNA recombinase